MKIAWPRLSKPIRVAGCLLALSPFILGSLTVCSGVREEALEASCQSNQKNLALALRMYAQDYDDYLPSATKWMEAANPYVENNRSFRCPKLNNAHPEEYGYAYNSLLASKLLSKIKAPETIPMLFDSDWLWRNAHVPGMTSLANPPRHNWYSLRDMMTYADGHAKSITLPGRPVDR